MSQITVNLVFAQVAYSTCYRLNPKGVNLRHPRRPCYTLGKALQKTLRLRSCLRKIVKFDVYLFMQTPVQNKLNDTAKKVDKETKRRHETCKMLRQNKYKFLITPTNFFTKSNKCPQKRKETDKPKQANSNDSSKTDTIGTGHTQQLTTIPTRTSVNTGIISTMPKTLHANYIRKFPTVWNSKLPT